MKTRPNGLKEQGRDYQSVSLLALLCMLSAGESRLLVPCVAQIAVIKTTKSSIEFYQLEIPLKANKRRLWLHTTSLPKGSPAGQVF